MGNPLLELQPNKVSRDIGSYVIYIYGSPKIGKTRFAADFPQALFLATEPTYKAVPGITVMDITSWGEFKKTLRNLKDAEVQKTFKTIVIDTIDLAADFCEQYICNQKGVEKIGDIPYGGGYGMVEKEFEKAIRQIVQMNYGLVLVSHVKDGTFTRDDGTEYNKVVPAVSSKRCLAVAENMADVYGWAHVKDGTNERVLTIRQENNSVSGGNHFKYLKSEIPLSYQAMEKAIHEAIDQEEAEMGSHLFTDERNTLAPTVDFDDLVNKFNTAVNDVRGNVSADDWKALWAPKIQFIVEKNLGKGGKVAEMTPNQAEILDLIVSELYDAIGQGL